MRSMTRRALIATGMVLLSSPGFAPAQPRVGVWKVAHLGIVRPTQGRLSPGLERFLQRLSEFGYAEGHNLAFEQRYSDGDVKRFPSLVQELLALDLDVMHVLGTPAAQAVKEVSAIPIVMIGGRAPVESGLAKTLARPGGTVTGLIQDVGHDVSIKAFELLRDAVPRAARIAVLTSAQAENEDALRLLQSAAGSVGVTVHRVMANDQLGIESAFTWMASERVHAFLALPSHSLLAHRQLVVDLAARHRIAGLYWFDDFVKRGGLLCYGIDWADLYRRSADYVAKIFKGARPGDLPIEQPSKFHLIVNMRAARAIGLTIPASLLLRADQLID